MPAIIRFSALALLGAVAIALTGCGNGSTFQDIEISPNLAVDLEASAITANPTSIASGGITNVTVFIRNPGTEDITSDFVVELTVNAPGGGIILQTPLFVFGGLASGATTQVIFNGLSIVGANGGYTVQALVDSTNEVTEDDESNNTVSTVITVSSFVVIDDALPVGDG